MIVIDIEATREGRRVRKNGDEQDAFSRKARRALAPLHRAGVTAKAKTIANQRTRRQVREGLRHWTGE